MRAFCEPPNAAPSSRMISIGKHEQEEDVCPPAKQAAQVGGGDRECLHRATSLPMRVNASAPGDRRRTRASPRPARAPPTAPRRRSCSRMPRRNHACGVSEAERGQHSARLGDREERAAEHAEHERDHRLPGLGLIGRARERRNERHHACRREHAGARSGSPRRARCPSARRAGSGSPARARPCSRHPSTRLVSSLPASTAPR